MNIAVVGSRSWDDEKRVHDFLDNYKDFEDITVISGGARGVDTFAANWAKKNGFKLVEYLPMWRDAFGRYNPQAGFERNTMIISLADLVVAFQRNNSGGTQDSINKAMDAGIPVDIIPYE